MSTQEPRTFWNWAITGLGGLINMMERVVGEGCEPGKQQVDKLENLTRRIINLYERFSNRPARSISEINRTRSFGSREVFDDYPDAQYQDRQRAKAETERQE